MSSAAVPDHALAGRAAGQKAAGQVDHRVEFTEKTKALSQYCSKQPNDSILSAAEKTFVN